ncbi:MAG: hypothetical protein AMXMBFR66_04030 [Pseudomonadota bacterium]
MQRVGLLRGALQQLRVGLLGLVEAAGRVRIHRALERARAVGGCEVGVGWHGARDCPEPRL